MKFHRIVCPRCSMDQDKEGFNLKSGYFKLLETPEFVIFRCKKCGADFKIKKEEKLKTLCKTLYASLSQKKD